jgi:cell division protein FtsZ
MAKKSYSPNPARIKVIGVGGAGCNAITRMVREEIRGVEFIAMNTDAQHLSVTEAEERVQLGPKMTRGLGSGGDQNIGERAAKENQDELKEIMADTDMVFLAAGMGGGTGTGSLPVVAEIAKQSGALTIAVVTKPFTFEGSKRWNVAQEGINNTVDKVDTLIIISNDRLLNLCDQKTGMDGAFKLADEALCHGVRAIAEVITVPGLVNLDFADVKAVMKDAGPSWMSIGRGTGQNRSVEAAREALNSSLLDASVKGAKGVLFNIAGDDTLTLFEVSAAADVIRHAVDPEANIIFGVMVDPKLERDVRFTLIATGFINKEELVTGSRERELTRLLKNIKTEEELAVPAFLRQHRVLSSQHQGTKNPWPS